MANGTRLWSLTLLLATGGCFAPDGSLGETALACTLTSDCPAPRVCLLGACTDPDAPCLDLGPDRATPQADGNACGDGFICVSAACVAPRCGDGIVTGDEGCDDGDDNGVAPGACRATCEPARCGDGIEDPGEACDHGDQNSDTDADACRRSCVLPSCGDGAIDTDEACDDGTGNSDTQPNACRTSCVTATCGDGIRDLDEGCDFGFLNSDTEDRGCRTTCVLFSCGDGALDAGEACDDGPFNNDTEPGACRTNCLVARCGDGALDVDEVCDDGPLNSDTRANACRTNCALFSCGDGVRDTLNGEECDDGDDNADDADACRLTCERPRCGDSILDTGESCDTTNFVADSAAEACSPACREMRCGDRLVDPENGETCDDGNDNPVDGCDACAVQRWVSEVVVSGAVGGRVARDGVLAGPTAVAHDTRGRLFVADTGGHRVLRIDLDGSMSVIAGTGFAGSGGLGGPATRARLSSPRGVAVDASDRVFIADTGNHRIVGIDTNGVIGLVAGTTGVPGTTGDGGAANVARLRLPEGLAIDATGTLFIADTGNHRIRQVDRLGIITAFAGTGVAGFAGDGGLATNATLFSPHALFIDADGSVLIGGSRVVRRVLGDRRIVRAAGSAGGNGLTEGADEAAVAFGQVVGVVTDPAGRLLIANDAPPGEGAPALLRIDNGRLVTLSGRGTTSGVAAETLGAPLLRLPRIGGLSNDPSGRAVFTDVASLVWRLEPDPDAPPDADQFLVRAVAGLRASARLIEAPLATSFTAQGVAADDIGNVYIADPDGHRVLLLSPDGALSTFAGTGTPGFNGDNIPADAAQLHRPTGVAVLPGGGVVIADSANNRVRVVGIDGSPDIVTIFGTGNVSFTGCCVRADDVDVGAPTHVATDATGRVFVANQDGIFQIDGPDQPVRTVARSFFANFDAPTLDGIATSIVSNGDGGVFTSVNGEVRQFSNDIGVELDPPGPGNGPLATHDGNLVVCDRGAVRRVSDSLVLAGDGIEGIRGDGGNAAFAFLHCSGLASDASGRLIIAGGDRVRRVDSDGTIASVFGAIHPPGPGAFLRAALYPGRALLSLDERRLLSVSDVGLAMLIDLDSSRVEVVYGYQDAAPERLTEARFAEPAAMRGVAFVPGERSLLATDGTSRGLRRIDLDTDADGRIDDPSAWRTATPSDRGLATIAGLAFEDADTVLVVDEANHCVRRLRLDNEDFVETVFGRCGSAGSFAGFLQSPTHIALSPTSGALYIADTGNHRVLRVVDGAVSVVIGDGSISSAGEGSPARRFPVNAPGQLALDARGNLYVTSTTAVRLVANIDGDADADGDDRVFTIYGGGDRDTFPESTSLCMNTVVLQSDRDVYAADTCQGFLVRMSSVRE